MGIRVLTREEREVILQGWKRGDSSMDIAYRLGISQATVYAELRRGKTEDYDPVMMRFGYDPDKGEQVYMDNIKKRGNRVPRVRAAVNE